MNDINSQDNTIRTEEKPDVVILSGQTCEEVKGILKKTKDPLKSEVDNIVCKSASEVATSGNKTWDKNLFDAAKCAAIKMAKTGKPSLLYEEESSTTDIKLDRSASKESLTWDTLEGKETLLVLSGLKTLEEEELRRREEATKLGSARLHGNFDEYHTWRKAAGLSSANDKEIEGVLNPTKELMGFILVRINEAFPKLRAEWTKGTWNPRLLINESPTQVSLEKLAISYKGLLNLTDDLNAQSIIANIVLKKLKELFI